MERSCWCITLRKAEPLWVDRWLKNEHRNALTWTRPRLGEIPPGEFEGLMGVVRCYPDAIFVEDNVVHIVEGKLEPNATGVGQLQLYAQEFPKTPEFTQFKNLPVKLIFLTTRYDSRIEELCKLADISYVIYPK